MAGFAKELSVQFSASRPCRAGARQSSYSSICGAVFGVLKRAEVPSIITLKSVDGAGEQSQDTAGWTGGRACLRLAYGRAVAIPGLPAPNTQALVQLYKPLPPFVFPSMQGRVCACEVETQTQGSMWKDLTLSSLT